MAKTPKKKFINRGLLYIDSMSRQDRGYNPIWTGPYEVLRRKVRPGFFYPIGKCVWKDPQWKTDPNSVVGKSAYIVVDGEKVAEGVIGSCDPVRSLITFRS